MNNTVDIEIYEILKSKFNDKEATVLLNYFNHLSTSKMEHSKDLFATKQDVSEAKSEIIKWMFVFWIGNITGSALIVKLLFL